MKNQTALTIRQWRYDGERPNVGMLLTTSDLGDHLLVEGRFITFDPDDLKPRNLDSEQPLDDVVARAQVDLKPASYEEHPGRLYGWGLRLQGWGIYDTAEVAAKAKAMALIEKRIDRIATAKYDGDHPHEHRDHHGALTFAEWFRDLIEAVGIYGGYIVRYADGHEPQGRNGGGMYDEHEYEPLSVAEAIEWAEQQAKGALK